MDIQKVNQIFADTAYVRMGGTEEERKCAEYLASVCEGFGCKAELQPFDVDMATIRKAVLVVDGVEIPCKGYFCAGSATVEAPFYYLSSTDPYSLSQIRGKIVMIDGYMGTWRYPDLLDNGAVGFITYDGNVNYTDRDIDQRELRSYVSKGNKLPGVNINVKDAVELVRGHAKTAKIILEQDEYTGQSHNVVLELPGEVDEYITLTAHYDSTSLSQGAYDNMSGSVGIMAIAEYFTTHPHRRGIRMILCGSEERGLLGSKAYVAQHPEEVEKTVLNINLDMIGSVMGKFISCVTGEEKLCHYLEYFGSEMGFPISSRQDVYSSDSSPFADAGVPAISFARLSPPPTGTIHNSYDTSALLSADQMLLDIRFICAFADRMANAVRMPVKREIPDNMKERLDEYLGRKRPKN
ncbi:MAG: M28 family peptidase [Oscillospiraceae bacterium]|nr:M28 family peptidase [Oscillospiraceae bacterium]MBR2890692.1 M28 family peptidase [Oscillospiraceae bacterium]